MYCFAFWYGFLRVIFGTIFFYKRKIQVYLQLLGTFKLEKNACRSFPMVNLGRTIFFSTEKNIHPLEASKSHGEIIRWSEVKALNHPICFKFIGNFPKNVEFF